MPDLEVKINSMYPPGASGGIRAYASVTMDGCLGIRGVKVVEGNGAKERTAAGPPEPNASPPHRHDKP